MSRSCRAAHCASKPTTWGNFADDAEQQVVRAVAAGDADLAGVGAPVLDTLGVTSFRALRRRC